MLELVPKITVKDFTFQEKYVYEHPKAVTTPRQDFVLAKWDISSGINADMGRAHVEIEDYQNQIDISAGDILEIKLNNDVWFQGICDEPEVVRPGYNQKKIKLTAVGYGIVLASKFISTNFEEKKISDIVQEVIKDDFPDNDIQEVNITLPQFVNSKKDKANCSRVWYSIS